MVPSPKSPVLLPDQENQIGVEFPDPTDLPDSLHNSSRSHVDSFAESSPSSVAGREDTNTSSQELRKVSTDIDTKLDINIDSEGENSNALRSSLQRSGSMEHHREEKRNTLHSVSASQVVKMPTLPEDEVVNVFSEDRSRKGSDETLSPPDFSPERENLKCIAAIVLTIAAWTSIFVGISTGKVYYKEPQCEALPREKRSTLRTCEVCGQGTLLLPLFGEYENSWSKGPRVPLYFAGLLCIFMGMGIVCDMFMDAIEEITSAETLVWKEVHSSGRHKFRLKIWNPTMANLTLMALGSSAPEIILSATELLGNRYFAGKLGPATIVGSAAFNLFVISSVCVAAIPAPEIRMVEGTAVFFVTSICSLFAYMWMLIIVLFITPDKVDIWEGVVTLAFFPIFLILAFLADKQVGPFKYFGTEDAEARRELLKKQAREKYGDVPEDTLKLFLAQPIHQIRASRAQLRRIFTGGFTGGLRRPKFTSGVLRRLSWGKDKSRGESSKRRMVSIGFADKRYIVAENAGSLSVKVVASQPLEQTCQVRYFTSDGTARAGLRYQHTTGFLSFAPGVTQRSIEIPIIDDDQWEPEEEFYINLADVGFVQSSSTSLFGASTSSLFGISSAPSAGSGDKSSGSNKTRDSKVCLGDRIATVTVLNDDEPGTLGFDADEVFTCEGETCTIGIVRTVGSCGKIYCKCETIDVSAVADKDYEPFKGVVEFEEGETHKTININIKVSPDHEYEMDERFKIRLSDPSPGVLFDRNTDGGTECAICDVIISGAIQAGPLAKCIRRCYNKDRLATGFDQWYEQIVESLYVGGSPQDQADAGFVDWLCHVTSLIFKLAFMVVPPSILGGGWCRFFASLGMIGVVTGLAGDISSLLGCCIGIPDDITAVTLVALGTSLPDTLASKAAALADETADNAIGNITGSNCVNVFLGIGISWTIGAVYWERSTPPTEEWEKYSFNGKTFKDLYLDKHPYGGFFVPTSTLAFSVGVYTGFALVCLAYLQYRRYAYGGELGGPACSQRTGALFLFFLWVVYIVAVSSYAGSQE